MNELRGGGGPVGTVGTLLIWTVHTGTMKLGTMKRGRYRRTFLTTKFT